MARYNYSSLNSEQKQVRLLELQPGRYGRRLHGKIRLVNLEDHPTYEALSYTWGPITEDRCIFLDEGATLPLSDNLYRALQRLRHRLRKRVLWIDQICINQADLDERSAQVGFMGEIYASAQTCAIWLGDVDDATLAGTSRFIRLRLLYCLHSSFWASYFRARSPVEEPWRTERWSFLITMWDMICLRIYFMGQALEQARTAWIDRSWVRQEFCLSKKRSFYFGSHKIDHPLARLRMSTWLLVPPSVFGGGYPGLPWCKELDSFINRVGSMDPDFTDLLAMISMEPLLGVSDPRDKVYSLLSMVTSKERGLIAPNYDISCPEVFARATFAAIAGCTSGFKALLFVSFTDPGIHLKGLPTWAIKFDDFTTDRFLLSQDLLQRSIFPDCSERCQPLVSMNPGIDWRLLHVTGVLIEIAETSSSFSLLEESAGLYDEVTPIMPADELLHNALQLKRTNIPGCIDACRWTEFPTIQEILHPYVQTGRSSQLSMSLLLQLIFSLPGTMENGDSVAYWALLETYARYVCRATGGCKLFRTTGGLLGVAPNLIQPTDQLVYPLFDCAHNDGPTNGMHRFLHQPTLVLHPKGGAWEFRGVAYVDGLEKMGLDRSQAETFVIF